MSGQERVEESEGSNHMSATGSIIRCGVATDARPQAQPQE
jgi:hypothetical protein